MSVWLDNLTLAYAELALRVEREIYRGDQFDMFDVDLESRLGQRWSFFAVNTLRGSDMLELTDRSLDKSLWRDPTWT